MATRIFPSLSLHPDAADDDAPSAEEFVAPKWPVAKPDPEPEAQPTLAPEPVPAPEPEPQPEPEPKAAEALPDLPAARAPEPKPLVAMSPVETPPIAEQPPERAERKEQFTFTPALRTTPAPKAEPAPPAPEASDESLRPARFDELNPAKDYGTPDEVYDLDNWLTESQDEAQPAATQTDPELTPDPVTPPELDVELPPEQEVAPPPERDARQSPIEEPAVADNHDDVTVTEDDRVDGYAFMRDPRSRRSAVVSAPQGRQSALRAKLLREAEEDAAEALRREESGSPFMAFWTWLKALFAPKG